MRRLENHGLFIIRIQLWFIYNILLKNTFTSLSVLFRSSSNRYIHYILNTRATNFAGCGIYHRNESYSSVSLPFGIVPFSFTEKFIIIVRANFEHGTLEGKLLQIFMGGVCLVVQNYPAFLFQYSFSLNQCVCASFVM